MKYECIKEFGIHSDDTGDDYQVSIGEIWEEDQGAYFEYDPLEPIKNLITDRDGEILYCVADPEFIKEHFKLIEN